MSELATDPTAAAPPAEATPPAPAPAATAPAPEMIQVPADQLGQYGKDWHAVMADAKYGREARDGGLFELATILQKDGTSPSEHVAWLNNFLAEQQAQAATVTPAPQEALAQAQPALTIDQVRETVTGVLRDQESHRSQTDLRQAEATYRDKVLDDGGYKLNEDGSLSSHRRSANRIWDGCVMDALLDKLPSYASDEDRDKALRGVASPEVLAEAEKRFKEDMADFGNETVAAAATQQETVPGETLSGGPGGSEPPKNFEDMTDQEQKAATMANVDLGDEERATGT